MADIKNFKTAVSEKVEKSMDALLSKYEKLKDNYKELKEKIGKAKIKLRAAIETMTADKALDDKEKASIFAIVNEHIPANILKEQKISNVDSLFKYLGVSEIKGQAKYEKYSFWLSKKTSGIDRKEYNKKRLSFNSLLEDINDIKKEPWARDLMIKAVSWYPGGVISAVRFYKTEPWAKEVMLAAVKNEGRTAWKQITAFKDEPWAKEVLDATFSDCSKYSNIFYLADKLIGTSWLNYFVKKSLPKFLETADKNIMKYYYMPFASEIYSCLADLKPKRLFELIENLGLYVTGVDTVMKAAENYPEGVPLYFKGFINYPGGKEIFQIGINKLGVNIFKDTLGKIKGISCVKEIVNEFVSSMNPNDGDKLFSIIITEAPELPWVKDILIYLAPLAKETAFKNYRLFKEMPWAKDVLLAAEPDNLEKVESLIEKNKDEKEYQFDDLISDLLQNSNDVNAIRQLKQIAKEKPFIVFKNYEKYSNLLTFPEEVLMEATNSDPKFAFLYLHKYKHEKWASSILLEAINVDSSLAFTYFDILITLHDSLVIKLLRNAARGNKKKGIIDYYHKYKHVKGAQEILIESIEGIELGIMLKIDDFIDLPSNLLKKLFLKVAQAEPSFVLNRLHLLTKIDKLIQNKIIDKALDSFSVSANSTFPKVIFTIYKNINIKEVKDKFKKRYIDPYLKLEEYKSKTMGLDVLIIENLQWSGDYKKQELMKDPLIGNYIKIKDEWLKPLVKDKFQLEQMKLIIVRNLAYKKQEITKESALKEFERVLKLKEKYHCMKVFKGRTVIYLTHNEKWKDGTDRFGKKATIDAIRTQGGKLTKDQFLKPKNTIESLKKTKEKFLNLVVNAKPPMTVFFEGHSGPNGLYFQKGQIVGGKVKDAKKYCKVTPKELSVALKKREERLRKKPYLLAIEEKSPPILIYNGCYSQNYLRNLIKQNKEHQTTYIHVGVSEYGQYGYDDPESKTGGKFNDMALGLSRRGHITTLGTIMLNERNAGSNPSIFISSGKAPTKQIAEKKKKNDEMMA